MVALTDLGVERPIVVKPANEEQATGEQIQQPRAPLALTEPVKAEHTEERQQNPRDRVVDWASHESLVCRPIHRGNQKEINQPADEEQPEGEKPDRAGHRSAIVEAMRSGETEYPEQVADDLAVRVGDPFMWVILLWCDAPCDYR